MPKVSIVVPVYKVEKYICRCVDSLLNQTYTDYEIILVDDGSPDNSGKICEEYAKKDDRIKVVHKKNGGLSSARNAGIRNSTAEYILFCDSDDYVSPDWCRIMVETMENNPSAFIVSGILKTEDSTELLSDKEDNSLDYNIINTTYFDLYKRGVSGYAVNKIYKRDVLINNDLFFDENCYYAEDVPFNVKYCQLCDKVIFIDRDLYYYIQYTNSIVHKYYAERFYLFINPFWCRIPLINEDELGEYCDLWLFDFLVLFENVFDKRNKMNFWQKMSYNNKMLNTKEIKYCIKHCTGKSESALFMKVLRTHNYYLFRAFQQLLGFKKKIKGGK